MDTNGHRATLGVISFGMAMGVTAAILVAALGIMASFFGWGLAAAQILASVFIGFGPTFVGTITGAVWAFVIGLISGVIFAWHYNRFLLRGARRQRDRNDT